MRPPVRVGIVGIHHYSRTHLRHLAEAEAAGRPLRRVAAVAHAREQDEAFAAQLEREGLRLVPTLDDLLALRGAVDLVTLPVGIPLHVPMASAALEAGFAVYLEKPVAGAIQDVDALAAVAARTPGPLFIGFQDGFKPSTWELKRGLLEGRYGRLRHIVVDVSWPRDDDYYQRNRWAGALLQGDCIVLDSPLNNACAHFMNLALFLAGAELATTAQPCEVTAELYRANPIASADTVSVRVTTAEGPAIVFNATHAGVEAWGPNVRLACDDATIETPEAQHAPWAVTRRGRADGQIAQGWPWWLPFDHAARRLLGEDVPVYTLPQARAHTLVVNGAHLSSGVQAIPAEQIERRAGRQHGQRWAVPALDAAVRATRERAVLLGETGLLGWARPGRAVRVDGLKRLVLVPGGDDQPTFQAD